MFQRSGDWEWHLLSEQLQRTSKVVQRRRRTSLGAGRVRTIRTSESERGRGAVPVLGAEAGRALGGARIFVPPGPRGGEVVAWARVSRGRRDPVWLRGERTGSQVSVGGFRVFGDCLDPGGRRRAKVECVPLHPGVEMFRSSSNARPPSP